MTLNECRKIIAYVSSAYPRFYNNMSRNALEQQTRVWSDVLAEYPYNDVYMGAQGYISADASGFPPSPGQIVEYIHRIAHPADRNGPEAWALVRRAVRHSGWDARASFASLPPLVQRAVGDAESLRAMALTDIDTLETVCQSNFLRTYEAVARRAAIEQRLPQRSRAMIEARGPKAIETKADPEPMRRHDGSVPAPDDMMEKLRRRLGGTHEEHTDRPEQLPVRAAGEAQ